jgi:hypothetical protein
MHNRQRDFLLLAILAAAYMTPAWGQGVAPAFGPASSSTRSIESIPDFSGTWSNESLNALEPPLSGPGPVRNRSRLRTGRQAGVGDSSQLVGDYTNPILQPWAAEVLKKFGDISLAGKGYPTPRNQCWPEGMPFVSINRGMQMLQHPDKITILYPFDHQFRQVRMNEPHPAQVTPSWYGNSVGHYEGDELVIDTVGIKVGRFSMIDWFGTPYTQALHLVERYRLLDYEATMKAVEWAAKEHAQSDNPGSGPPADPNYKGKGLQIRLTVEDRGAFTMPWSATLTFPKALSWMHSHQPIYSPPRELTVYRLRGRLRNPVSPQSGPRNKFRDPLGVFGADQFRPFVQGAPKPHGVRGDIRDRPAASVARISRRRSSQTVAWRAVNPGYLLSRLSSIMASVAAWLDAQGGLDTHSRASSMLLRHTLQHESGPA